MTLSPSRTSSHSTFAFNIFFAFSPLILYTLGQKNNNDIISPDICALVGIWSLLHSVCQRLMNLVRCGLTYDTCLVYLDDITVFIQYFDSHIE